MLTGWRTASREQARRHARLGALAVGGAAALAMGVVGCTSIIGGSPQVNVSEAPAYRSSVSASEATSSIRETERQQSMTTQAVRGACGRFASSSSDAVDTVNKYVEAFNNGGDIPGTAAPAIEALNHSADEVTGAVNDKLSAELKEAFGAYAEAARGVANAISTKAPIAIYNARKDELNRARQKGMELCRAF